MHAPQITMIALWALSFGVVAVKHGEPKGDYNAASSLLSIAIYTALLWWGGFWTS